MGGSRTTVFLARPRNLIAIVATVLASAMLVVAVTRVSDPDVWWVAAAGREMLARHVVPRENLFSFVEPSHPWVMHEWLFGPVYALGLARFGPAFFSAVALAAMGTALALLAVGTVGRARNAWVGLAMLLAATVFFGGRFLSARPTGVALVFPIALAVVAFGARFTWRSVAAVTAIELVWTNAHGSFPLGVVILVVAAADGAGRREDRGRRFVAAGSASVATLANPYGVSLHRFVWDYFRGDVGVYRSINLHIKEFGSFADAWGYTVGPIDLVALVLFLALAGSAARDARYRVRALFCLALFALAVVHARHLEIAGLISCLLLLPYVDDLADRSHAPPALPAGRGAWGVGLLLPGALLSLLAFANVARARPTPGDWILAGPDFLRSLSAVPDGSRLLVPFPTAGLAIWYASPRGVRVFFDSRNDCYSADTFAEFWALESLNTSVDARRAALRGSATDTALVPSWDPMSSFLATEPGWAIIRQEEPWRVFRRRP